MKIDREKHVWEGWTVGEFIDSLSPEMEMIMKRMSWKSPFKTKEEVKKHCMENQPYYKKHIPEVVDYFVGKYNIK
jgi:hypothetical protein